MRYKGFLGTLSTVLQPQQTGSKVKPPPVVVATEPAQGQPEDNTDSEKEPPPQQSSHGKKKIKICGKTLLDYAIYLLGKEHISKRDWKKLARLAKKWHNQELYVSTACSGSEVVVKALLALFKNIENKFGFKVRLLLTWPVMCPEPTRYS